MQQQALAPEGGEDDPLYRAALEVEQDERLMAELADWDETVGGRARGGSLADPAQVSLVVPPGIVEAKDQSDD